MKSKWNIRIEKGKKIYSLSSKDVKSKKKTNSNK